MTARTILRCPEKGKLAAEEVSARRGGIISYYATRESLLEEYPAWHLSGRQIKPFSEGLAARRSIGGVGSWGFVDADGEEVIPAIFAKVGQFRNGVAVCQVLPGLTPRKLPSGYDTRFCAVPYVAINANGEILLDSSLPIYPGLDGSYLVWAGDKWQFRNTAGETLLPEMNFAEVRPRSADGLFFARCEGSDRFDLLDGEGRLVSTDVCQDARVFNEGLCAVKVEGKWGYCDRTGRIVIVPRFSKALEFEDGFAMVRVDDNGIQVADLIDTQGKRVLNQNIISWIYHGNLSWHMSVLAWELAQDGDEW
jgi:hypothetical protein